MNTLWQATRRFLVLGTVLYTTALVGLVLVWHSPAASLWWLQLLNIFAPYLFVPLVVLVPLGVPIRSWPFRGAVLLAGVLFLGLFTSSLFPPSEQAATQESLTVLTFNMLFVNEQDDAIVSAIQSSGADIVGLQELSHQAAAAIQDQLRQTHPYQLLNPATDPSGLGIISRYPFQVPPEAQHAYWQHVILDVDGQPVDLLNIHFTPGHLASRSFPITGHIAHNYETTLRDQQMVEALHVIDAIQGPVIVLGDFNISDRESAYRQFDQRLHDAYRETAWGFGLTYPNKVTMGRLPVPSLVRIDYVWSGGGILPLTAQVQCATTGSDHCMMQADLALDHAAMAQQPAPAGRHVAP